MEHRDHIPLGELYQQRVLIFIETDSFTNKYRQLYLNQEQYNILSNFLMQLFPIKEEGKMKFIQFEHSKKIFTLPDVQSVNE